MKLSTLQIFTCLGLILGWTWSVGAQTKRALLIGIETYQPAGTKAEHPQGCTYGRCDLSAFDNLPGARNDVVSMRDLLTSPKFGFPSGNVIAITDPILSGGQRHFVNLGPDGTTHEGILSAMQKYLVEEPKRGDTVVFYYSGHGSLRVNSKGTKLTLVVDGKVTHADNTIVPSDAWRGAFDVRDRELTRIFNAALDKGVKLTVIFDSCNSGGIARGIRLGDKIARQRWVAYDPRDINEAPDLLPTGELKSAPAERGDNPALIFSASQQDQVAQEIPPPNIFLKPHGAFTVALIKALQVLPANAPASLVYQRVNAYMEGVGIDNQLSSMDAGPARRDQPLFGGASGAHPVKLRSAVVDVDSKGDVFLDAGELAGIGSGSEFRSLAAGTQGQKVTVKVIEPEGIARSRAKLVCPLKSHIAPGEVFELTKWVPAPFEPLRVWMWPANLSQKELTAVTELIRSAGIVSVEDPVEQPWTDMISWDGANWKIAHAGSNSSTVIGSTLTKEALARVPPDAKVWVNLPPPKEIAGRIELHDPQSAVEGVGDVSNAEYVLAGTLHEHGPAWAWVHKVEFLKGPPEKIATDRSPGCSTWSPYPVRTDWIDVTDATAVPQAADLIGNFASRLAKLYGWVNLPSSLTSAAREDYYRLTFMRVSDQSFLSPGDRVHQDDRLKMFLTSSVKITDRRWVYVLRINCHGEGKLLYPFEYSENQFPNDANDENTTELRGARTLKVNAPYGLETIIFISTRTPLPDPYGLNFEGVTSRQVQSTLTPLQRLLGNTSSGRREPQPQTPTDWSIDLETLRSVPNPNP
jgi:hypothetical protein